MISSRCVKAQNHTQKSMILTPHQSMILRPQWSLLLQTPQVPEYAIPSVSPVSCWMPGAGGSQTPPVDKCVSRTNWTLSSVPDLQRAFKHQPQEFPISPCHPQLVSRVQRRLPAWESGKASHGPAAKVLCDPNVPWPPRNGRAVFAFWTIPGSLCAAVWPQKRAFIQSKQWHLHDGTAFSIFTDSYRIQLDKLYEISKWAQILDERKFSQRFGFDADADTEICRSNINQSLINLIKL